MKNKRKFFVSVAKIICFFVAVLMIVYIPSLDSSYALKNNLTQIYNSFIGEKSSEPVMIEIWNIDSFEGGKISKTALLKDIASVFQTKNKNYYVLVRNLSESECKNMLESGQMPDLISCCSVLYDEFKDYVERSNYKNTNIINNLQEANANCGEVSIPWCYGLYFLCTTSKNLKNISSEFDENLKLSSVAFSLGKEIKNKKSTKIVYSLCYGGNSIFMPPNAISSYNSSEEKTTSPLAYNKSEMSFYDAYVEFLLGNSTLLLGTQRDVFRLSSRLKNGKISDLIIEPLFDFCDLIQCMFLTSKGNEKIDKVSKFLNFLLSDSQQQKIADSGLFSVIKNISYENAEFGCDITSENLEKIKFKMC